MAFSDPTLKAQGGGSGDATAYATASWTPAASGQWVALCLISAKAFHASNTVPIPTVTGNGLTWELVVDHYWDNTLTDTWRQFLFAAKSAGGSAGATTATFSVILDTALVDVIEFEDTGGNLPTDLADIFGEQVVSAVNPSASTGVTLTFTGTPDATALIISAFTHKTHEVTNPDSDYTELVDHMSSQPNNLEIQYKNGSADTVASATWATSSAGAGFAIEIIPATVGGGGTTVIVRREQVEKIRYYGVSDWVTFGLYEPSGEDLVSGLSFAAGDVKISKDEGAAANTTNLPSEIGTTGTYKLQLTATEMEAKRVTIRVADQGTKTWQDITLCIETLGHASAQFPDNFDDIAEAIYIKDVDDVEATAPIHSLAGLVLKGVSRIDFDDVANTITIYRTDGTTVFFTQTTQQGNVQPITDVGVAT